MDKYCSKFKSSRIFDTVIAKWALCVQQFFFGQKLSKVAIIKTKSTTVAFPSSPPFLLLALSFSPLFRYCDFGTSRVQQNLPLDAFSLK